MESASDAGWNRVKALSGTALLMAVVTLVLEDDPTPADAVLALAARALLGGVSTPAEGVNVRDVVIAFDPADADPEDENEFAAPGPDAPDEALAWMYRFASVLGFCWKVGCASRIT